jgi:hypothetical protein
LSGIAKKIEPSAPFRGSDAALARAGKQAKKLGARTGTPVYILKDGKIVDLNARSGKLGSPSK